MLNQNLLIIIGATAILIWQFVITALFIKVLNRNKKLIELEKEDLQRQLVGQLGKRIDILEKEKLTHIQKVNLTRFNPFNETGGEASFTVCLLDGNLNGVVLTGLHTREKTRMYAKEIKEGKSPYKLSKEETKTLEEVIS